MIVVDSQNACNRQFDLLAVSSIAMIPMDTGTNILILYLTSCGVSKVLRGRYELMRSVPKGRHGAAYMEGGPTVKNVRQSPRTSGAAYIKYNCAHVRVVQTGWKNIPTLASEIYCGNLFLDTPLISIVDDDEALCRALQALVQSLGYRAVTYRSADAFLASRTASSSQCIIADVQMPGLSGFDLGCVPLRGVGTVS
jgi:hypothetical protein